MQLKFEEQGRGVDTVVYTGTVLKYRRVPRYLKQPAGALVVCNCITDVVPVLQPITLAPSAHSSFVVADLPPATLVHVPLVRCT